MTLDQIISTLKGAFVIPVKTRLRTMLLTAQKNLGMSDTKITGKGKFAASMNALEDADTIWNKYSNEVLNNPSDLGRIFEAAGLGTPAAAQSLPELKTTLKMDTLANDLVLSSVMRKHLEASPTLF